MLKANPDDGEVLNWAIDYQYTLKNIINDVNSSLDAQKSARKNLKRIESYKEPAVYLEKARAGYMFEYEKEKKESMRELKSGNSETKSKPISTCSACGEEIKWRQSIKDGKTKNIPVNPDLLNIQDNFTESDVLVLSPGGVFGKLSRVTEGYISHFDTCPNADQFRRKKTEVKEPAPAPVKTPEPEEVKEVKSSALVPDLDPWYLVAEIVSKTESKLIKQTGNIYYAYEVLIDCRTQHPEKRYALSCGVIKNNDGKMLRLTEL